jgi:hypothetical protein
MSKDVISKDLGKDFPRTSKDLEKGFQNLGKKKCLPLTSGGISWQTKSEVGDELDRINDLAREAAELDSFRSELEWEQYTDELSDDELFNRYVDDDDFLQEVHGDDHLLARE